MAHGYTGPVGTQLGARVATQTKRILRGEIGNGTAKLPSALAFLKVAQYQAVLCRKTTGKHVWSVEVFPGTVRGWLKTEAALVTLRDEQKQLTAAHSELQTEAQSLREQVRKLTASLAALEGVHSQL